MLESIVSKLEGMTRKGDIKKYAKEIKKNHSLALELWDTNIFNAMLLAVLIFDKSKIDEKLMDKIANSVVILKQDEQNYISDWLLANQLMKSGKGKEMLSNWIAVDSPFLRRLFWYYQARLRWTGKSDFDNTQYLVDEIKIRLVSETKEVQWAINFCAAWIGIYEKKYRQDLSEFGEQLGLYADEKVPKNCTPNYLPEFIRIEVDKRDL